MITDEQISDFWISEYASTDHCVLCGNAGIIDTRGKVFTATGYEYGARVYCICPNGRAIKRRGSSLNG